MKTHKLEFLFVDSRVSSCEERVVVLRVREIVICAWKKYTR